ncbi:nitric oxide synthase oxygenase [Paenibacillus marinisediminis]
MQHELLIDEAKAFIHTCYNELGKSIAEMERRIEQVTNDILTTGTYTHTHEELEYGAKLAWRNNSRCIGRLFWKTLKLLDARELNTEESIVEALFQHIEYATNQGRIRPTITIFAPETDHHRIRIWNHQLIRYAGYETEHGIIGDPASVLFTKQCQELGWQGEGTSFDILPLVVQIDQREPKWFSIPKELVLEVPISHPRIESFDELKLKWYGVPIISDMLLEIGGLRYTAAPFNGWYMVTEIASRNLADEHRYNALPAIARELGLDTLKKSTFWKDRAMLELNEAVYESFRKHNVSIVDHHSAAEQFMKFEEQEHEQGREVNARWSWLIPPLSPSATPIWHKRFQEFAVSPNYQTQPCPYQTSSEEKPNTPQCPFATSGANL